MLRPGDPAPAFCLPSTTGVDVGLEDLRGRKVVLYFYPRDQTPGCTQEACDFRDSLARLHALGAEVYGVSRDSIASHDRFHEKYNLSFPLLSDPDSAVATRFGAYGEKMMYGKRVMGTIRSTFIIDESGKILAAWSPVKVAGHAAEVLAVLNGRPPGIKKRAPPRARKRR